MRTSSTIVAPAVGTQARPACHRCGHRDRAGLAKVRGLWLCRVCNLIALARWSPR